MEQVLVKRNYCSAQLRIEGRLDHPQFHVERGFRPISGNAE